MSRPGAPRPGLADRLAWLAARLGPPGLAGLALLVAGIAVQVWLTPPLERDAAALTERAVALASQPRAAATAVEIEAPFADTLPQARQAARILAGLFAAAEAAGLELDQGNYRLTVDRQAGLQRQQITLPLVGTWPALRAFAARVLADHPSLALDGLRLAREAVTGGELKATLRFTLYLREGE